MKIRFLGIVVAVITVALMVSMSAFAGSPIVGTAEVSIENDAGDILIGIVKAKDKGSKGFKLIPQQVYNPETHSFHTFTLDMGDIPHVKKGAAIFVTPEVWMQIFSGEIELTGELGSQIGGGSTGGGGGTGGSGGSSGGGGSGGGGEGGGGAG